MKAHARQADFCMYQSAILRGVFFSTQFSDGGGLTQLRH